MIVIKHRQKPNKKYYYITCSCGCEFVCDDSELTRYKMQEYPYPTLRRPDIKCPECGNVNSIPNDTEIGVNKGNVMEITTQTYLRLCEETHKR